MIKIITCAYCSGKGLDPFNLLSPLATCLVCNQTGLVEVEEPFIKCVFCDGSGKNPLGARIPCIVCGGKGEVHCNSTVICPQCKGVGKSGDGLPCSRCKGVGFG
jgi:DnaJ-class molecular chaperone